MVLKLPNWGWFTTQQNITKTLGQNISNCKTIPLNNQMPTIKIKAFPKTNIANTIMRTQQRCKV